MARIQEAKAADQGALLVLYIGALNSLNQQFLLKSIFTLHQTVTGGGCDI
jgi:hypothetical protein